MITKPVQNSPNQSGASYSLVRWIKVFLVSSVCAQAALQDARDAYRDIPSVASEAQTWLEPHDESYLPYGYCTDIEASGSLADGVMQVTKIEDRVEYYWQSKDETGSLTDHYHCLFRIMRVTYRITCGNKLQYQGVKYLLSNTWKLNEFTATDSEARAFKRKAHDWVELPLSSLKEDGSIVQADGSEYGHDTKRLNKTDILNTWKQQSVAYPAYTFQGEPGKLPRPVLLIHGINSDFKVFGAYPLKTTSGEYAEKGSELFQSAKVSGYMNGSLPDILARNQNLDNTEAQINSNGIYFFQAPGAFDSEGNWKDVPPHWNTSNAKSSQSRALYDRLEEILTATYGDNWKYEDWAKIDLVCHSQGGLVVREMLRGLQANATQFPEGSANAANHINLIITADTPHFGSPLAGSVDAAENSYPGLGRLLDDLDKSVAGTPVTRTLVSASVDVDLMERLSEGASGGMDAANGWYESDHWYSALSAAVLPISSILGGAGGAAVGAFTDVDLAIKGPYFGPYSIEITTDKPWPISNSKEVITMEGASGYIEKYLDARYGGEHLDPANSFIRTLKPSKVSDYPTLPNGQKVSLLPMYSEDTRPVLGTIFGQLAKGADKLCAEKSSEPGCFAVGGLISSYVAKSRGYELSDVDLNDELWTTLNDLQDNWFKSSDGVVAAESQKFIDQNVGLSPNVDELKGFFKNPRTYSLHDALAPWEAVAHGPFKIKKTEINDLDAIVAMDNQGASRQGLDLVCALNQNCEQSLSQNASPVYLAKRANLSVATPQTDAYEVSGNSVRLSGNFQVTPIFVASGYQGVALEDQSGALRLVTGYVPGQGSYVWYKDINGQAHTEVLVSGSVATQPTLGRSGNQFTVSAVNYAGKSKELQISLDLSSELTLSVLGDKGASLAGVLVGSATPADVSTQQPPTPPVSLALVNQVRVYHREARGANEANTSRPRILVQNVSGKTLKGFKVAYYFTADPKRQPVVEFDYPHSDISLEYISGDLWRFVIDQSDVTLQKDGVAPSLDGWQIRLHYQDWANWISKDDYSANYSIGIAKINPKIVVYDNDGKVLWGQEPEPYSTTDNSVVPAVQAQLTWSDAVPSDLTTFKPMVTVRNVGSVSLEKYHALLYFRVPNGKQLVAPVSDWYTPEAQPTVRNLGGNIWELDLYFNEHMLYGAEEVTQSNMGLHLSDWSAFDKTILGIALVDSLGQVLYGSRWAGEASFPEDAEPTTPQTATANLQVFMKRETNESNYLKPRVRVYNAGEATVGAFTLRMQFATEDNQEPMLSEWFLPGCTSSLQSQDNRNYVLELACSSVNLSSGNYWPNESGATFGLNYPGWSDWDSSNDASFNSLTLDWAINAAVELSEVH